MPPALTPLLTSLGYGRLSVSRMRMHLRTVGLLLKDPLIPASHRSFIHFGEDHCHLSSEQSDLPWR